MIFRRKPEQIEFIANEIIKLNKQFSYADMAILCRTHEQSQQIIEYLNLIGIPNRSPKETFLIYPQSKI